MTKSVSTSGARSSDHLACSGSKSSKHCFLFVLVILCLIALQAQADVRKPIFVVDLAELVEKSILGQRHRNDFQAEAKKAQSSLQSLGKEVERLETDLRKSKDMLSQKVLSRKSEELREKKKAAKRKAEDLRFRLKTREGEALAEIVETIRKTVRDLAEEKGWGVVVENDPRLVAYVSPRIDVTDNVLKRLNTQEIGL